MTKVRSPLGSSCVARCFQRFTAGASREGPTGDTPWICCHPVQDLSRSFVDGLWIKTPFVRCCVAVLLRPTAKALPVGCTTQISTEQRRLKVWRWFLPSLATQLRLPGQWLHPQLRLQLCRTDMACWWFLKDVLDAIGCLLCQLRWIFRHHRCLKPLRCQPWPIHWWPRCLACGKLRNEGKQKQLEK